MHWLSPQQLCAVFLTFWSAQQFFSVQQSFAPAAAEHFSPQQPAEASILAQLLPSFPLQHEAISLLSFELDFACMQACSCPVEADVELEAALLQQAHIVLLALSDGAGCAGVDVCAQVVVARMRMKAISLYFMKIDLLYHGRGARDPRPEYLSCATHQKVAAQSGIKARSDEGQILRIVLSEK
jgi:hypothetical protein